MKNIIYSLYHPILTKDHDLNINGRKIGSTKYIKSRMKVYQTGYPIEVPLEYYYKIDQDCYEIDKLINTYFNEYRLNSKGSKAGTEFYDADKLTISVLENFFKDNNITFEKFTKDSIKYELNKTVTKKDTKLICKEDIYKNKHKNKKPHDYQNEIINKTIKYFEYNDKGILVEPCGVGKTLIASWIGEKINAQSILLGIPSLSLIKQWVIILNEIFPIPDYNYKIISCEEDDTTINDIQIFLKKNPKCILLTTYMSSHKVLKACSNFIFDYVVLDECHHLTSSNIEKFNTDNKMFIQILKIKSKKQLALTATLKDIEDNNIISNTNNEYFGEIIDRRCLYWAIKENILCDYNIQTVIVNELVSFENFNITSEIDKRLFIAAYCALKNINDGFSKHLLIYTNTTDNANRTIQYVYELIDNHYFDIKVFASKYDSTMTIKEQKSVMDNFLESEYAILSSVYCLGEGWDCPKLYGEVFAENMTSNIRIVQSALRAGRKYKEDPNKKFNIIIPVLNNIDFINENDDFKKIKEIIYQMGLEDETVTQKIIVSKINCDKNSNKLQLTNIKDFGKYDLELTEKIKLKTIPQIKIGITYEKAKKIIQSNKIKDSIYNKDSYYKLCEIDNRLPLKPDEIFKSTFKNWIDYLSISKIYYDLDQCKIKVNEYLKKYPDIKQTYLDLVTICNELCKLDSSFPPSDLWVDYYNIKDLTHIINITNKKKKSGVILS